MKTLSTQTIADVLGVGAGTADQVLHPGEADGAVEGAGVGTQDHPSVRGVGAHEVIIESPRGRVRQRAQLFEGMDPRIVSAQHAWWFPEKQDPGHGWQESNINILTDNSFEACDPAMGATNVRTLLCKIYPEKS